MAALAKCLQIPVIVASESYKFSDKVQLDSIVYNELGQTSEVAIMVKDTSSSVYLPMPQRQSIYRGSAADSHVYNNATHTSNNKTTLSHSTTNKSSTTNSSIGGSGADNNSNVANTTAAAVISIPLSWKDNHNTSFNKQQIVPPLPFNTLNLR